MWTIIILVLFVVAAIAALAVAMRTKPGGRDERQPGDSEPDVGTTHDGADAD